MAAALNVNVNPQDLLPKIPTYRKNPLTPEQWAALLDPQGKITDFKELRHLVFFGGVQPDLRREVWPFILEFYKPDSTYKERQNILAEKTERYFAIKAQWQTFSQTQEFHCADFQRYKSAIEKDTIRTDCKLEYYSGENSEGQTLMRDILMTYMMYNFDLGYVQGMSDILSPILFQIRDEPLAFWLYVKFMDKIEGHFQDNNQEGNLMVQEQLEHCYRLLQVFDRDYAKELKDEYITDLPFAFDWMLLWFKREFPMADLLFLWEALWTGLPIQNFQLLIALSVLYQYESQMMDDSVGGLGGYTTRLRQLIPKSSTNADTKDKPHASTPTVAKSLVKTIRNLKTFLTSSRKSKKDKWAEEILAEERLEEEKRAEVRVIIQKYKEEKARKKALKELSCTYDLDHTLNRASGMYLQLVKRQYELPDSLINVFGLPAYKEEGEHKFVLVEFVETPRGSVDSAKQCTVTTATDSVQVTSVATTSGSSATTVQLIPPDPPATVNEEYVSKLEMYLDADFQDLPPNSKSIYGRRIPEIYVTPPSPEDKSPPASISATSSDMEDEGLSPPRLQSKEIKNIESFPRRSI